MLLLLTKVLLDMWKRPARDAYIQVHSDLECGCRHIVEEVHQASRIESLVTLVRLTLIDSEH